MLARVLAATPWGIDALSVHVEVDSRLGVPGTQIVGLPDAAVRESRERVRSAVRNCGFDLPARYILHTVGPVWEDGRSGEAEQLAACYIACLELAVEHRLTSLAFPAISCGVFGYPPDQAVRIAVASVRGWRGVLPTRVVFCVFDAQMEARYRDALGERRD